MNDTPHLYCLLVKVIKYFVTHDGWIAATLGDTNHSMTGIVIRMRMQRLILLCGKKGP